MLLLLSAFALLLAACGGEATGSSDRQVLVMATSADFPPFEFINEDGEYDGFDIHMARALAEILDMDLRIDNMDFGGVLTAVYTGRANIAIAAISVTEERLQNVNFTNPYFGTTQVVLVQDASDITEIDQLENARIAVQLGTTSDLVAGWYLPDATVYRFNMAPDTILELRTGRVDAVIIDFTVASLFMEQNPEIRMLEDVLAHEEYAIAVNRDQTQLLEDLNEALMQLQESSEFRRIYEMFFGGQ